MSTAEDERFQPQLDSVAHLPTLAAAPTRPVAPAPVLAPAPARPAGPPPPVPPQHPVGTDWQPAPGHPVPAGAFEAFLREAAARNTVAPPSWKQQQRRRGGRSVLTAIVVLALLGTGVWFLAHSKLLQPKAKAPAHPSAWDPRLTELVAFVEQERGLKFDHPIYTDFLTEADFVSIFDVPAEALTDPKVKAENAERASVMNAFGEAVVYDPQQGGSAVSATTTLGFYDPSVDRIAIRGDQLTPAVRTTLAHELTHALQAQHFDIKLGGDDDLEVRAIVEADAMRVEDKYVATLSPEDQAAVNSENSVNPEQKAIMDSVPPVVIQTMYAPYALGPVLVGQVFATDGNAGVDRLIENPPTELALMEPSLFGTATVDATLPVNVPEGATVIDEPQRFSAFQFLVMLDAWLPWDMARGAVDDWTGGGYASYRTKEGTVCFVATAGYGRDTAKASTAMLWWAAAAQSTAVATVAGSTLTFTACDRGSTAPAPPAPVLNTLSELLMEHQLIEASVQARRDAGDVSSPAALRPMAVCQIRGLLSQDATIPLLQMETLTDDQRATIQQVMQQAASTCPFSPGAPPTFGTPVTP